MTRRFAFAILAAFLLIAACKEDRPRPVLSSADREILRAKADDKIGVIITENLPALFAGLVVFRSDAFLSQSHMLDQANISVLNMFGNTAILLLNSPDIPPLLKEPSVKKIHYLCRQGALVRLDTPFEIDIMRRFGEGKEDEPVTFAIRFRDPPEEKDASLITAAGFTIRSREGIAWAVTGPLRGIPRLLESDRIGFYSSASSQTGVTVTKEVPSAKETIDQIKDRESKEPTPTPGDRAAPSHKIRRDGQSPAPPGGTTDNSVK
jgi:hypothetical protein